MHKLHDSSDPAAETIGFDDFLKVDVRVGTIVAADPFPEARKPAYKLTIDFGPEIGIKQSSAQITAAYSVDDLIGRQVVSVVNLAPRRIAGFNSEVLVCGADRAPGEVILLTLTETVPNGTRIY